MAPPKTRPEEQSGPAGAWPQGEDPSVPTVRLPGPRRRPPAASEGWDGAPTLRRPREDSELPEDGLPSLPPDAPAQASLALKEGTRVGRYLVLQKLGQGGMGEVYSAYDAKLDRKVALKLLRPLEDGARGQGDADASARLLREAQAMARLSHPNVLPVHDVGEHEGRVFVAMSLVEGSTLREWLASEPRSPRAVLRVFLEAGRGLAAAHAKGLVHRDFKPDNVLLGTDGRVLVMDFGLARAHAVDAPPAAPPPAAPLRASTADGGRDTPGGLLTTQLTRADSLLGTPGYMAPEQYLGRGVGPHSDQFSFCASLHLALHGRPPFAGTTLQEVRAATLGAQVQPPPRGSGVPGWLHRVVLRGLGPRPEDRFPSMEALLAALQDDPALRRRRWAVAAGVVLALSGGAVLSKVASLRQETACRAVGRGYAEAWGEEPQRAVERAFLATGRTFARDAWREVKGALDGYTAGLSGMAEEACLATRVRGEASTRVLALRTACLDARKGGLTALVDVFSQADGQVVEQATRAVQGLAVLAPCANVDWLMRQVQPPGSKEAQAQLAALQASLARAKALHDSGKYAEAMERATRVAEGARRLPFAPLEAEALLQLGMSESAYGKSVEAERHLKEAARRGIVANQEQVAARAAASLVEAIAAHVERAAEARQWYEWGKAYVERAPEGQERTLAQLVSAYGLAVHVQEDYPEAERTLREALTLAQQAYGPRGEEVASVARRLGTTLVWRQKYAEALPMLLQAVSIMEERVGPEHPQMVLPLRALGTALSLAGQSEEALPYYTRALRISERTLSPTHRGIGMAYNNLAHAQLQLGRFEEAAGNFRRSLEVQEAAAEPETDSVVLTLSNLVDVLTELRRFREARAYGARALALGEAKLPPAHSSLLRVLLAQGALEVASERPAQAIPWLQRVLRHEKGARADPNHTFGAARLRLAQALWATRHDTREVLPLLAAARATLSAAGKTRYLRSLEAWAQEEGLPPSPDATAVVTP